MLVLLLGLHHVQGLRNRAGAHVSQGLRGHIACRRGVAAACCAGRKGQGCRRWHSSLLAFPQGNCGCSGKGLLLRHLARRVFFGVRSPEDVRGQVARVRWKFQDVGRRAGPAQVHFSINLLEVIRRHKVLSCISTLKSCSHGRGEHSPDGRLIGQDQPNRVHAVGKCFQLVVLAGGAGHDVDVRLAEVIPERSDSLVWAAPWTVVRIPRPHQAFAQGLAHVTLLLLAPRAILHCNSHLGGKLRIHLVEVAQAQEQGGSLGAPDRIPEWFLQGCLLRVQQALDVVDLLQEHIARSRHGAHKGARSELATTLPLRCASKIALRSPALLTESETTKRKHAFESWVLRDMARNCTMAQARVSHELALQNSSRTSGLKNGMLFFPKTDAATKAVAWKRVIKPHRSVS